MSQPRTVIDGELYEEILAHAEAACIGGSSAVRTDDRQEALRGDQIVGQLGEYAICRWFDDPLYYFERRAQINQNPTVGDGGIDYLTPEGMRVDVKTTLMRGTGPREGYRLAVRQRERHADNYYVLALVDQTEPPVSLWLMGWAHDSELRYMEGEGPLKGAWTIGAYGLRTMSTFDHRKAA